MLQTKENHPVCLKLRVEEKNPAIFQCNIAHNSLKFPITKTQTHFQALIFKVQVNILHVS